MPLQQPVREEAALAELGNRHIDGAGASVQVPMPVPVAAVGPLRVPGAVPGAAHAVGLSRQQGVDERRQQLPHQVRAGLSQLLVQEDVRVDTEGRGHRSVLLRVGCERSLEGSRGDRTYVSRTRSPGSSYTKAMDSTLLDGALRSSTGSKSLRPNAPRGRGYRRPFGINAGSTRWTPTIWTWSLWSGRPGLRLFPQPLQVAYVRAWEAYRYEFGVPRGSWQVGSRRGDQTPSLSEQRRIAATP